MPNEAKWATALAVAVGLVWVGWRFTWLLVTLHVMVCLLLVIVIMLQSGNAADLAGAFGGAGSQTAFGPRGPATFLSQATTWCAIVFMMTSMTLWLKRGPGQGSAESSINSILEQTQKRAPAKAPLPVQAPPPRPTPAMPPQSKSTPTMPAPAPAKP
jgi:preprotein translocase subunit SecG